jgi:adenylate cyclase
MTTDDRPNSRLRNLAKRCGRLGMSVVISLALVGACLAARARGWLERLELLGSDLIVRFEPRNASSAAPILIVLISEADIQSLPQYPISDGILAELLDRLLQFHPSVIGMDIFRDRPVIAGANDDGPKRLDDIIRKNGSIIWNFKYKGLGTGVSAPPALQAELTNPRVRVPLRVGFADAELDPDGVVRRMILRITESRRRELLSLDLQLARVWLRGQGIRIQLGAGPANPEPVVVGSAVLSPLGPNDGPYVNRPVNGIQQWHDFAGPSWFHTISLQQALKGSLSEADVKGAIVLVGVDAESEKDHFDTPIHSSPAEPGVSLHARATEQIIRAAKGQPMTQFLSKPREVAWIAVWGIAGGMLGFGVRSPKVFAVLLGIGIVTIALVPYLALRESIWVPVVPPLLCWVASPLFVTSYVSYQEKADRAVLMNLFARHVSKQVADTIWERRKEFIRDGRLVPRTQEATVLFTDLRDFTAISEKLEPVQLIALVNEYLNHMTAAVTAHDGVVNKYIGDSIMAIFGAPIPSTTQDSIANDARRAVECALAMRRELAALNAQWSAQGRGTVQMRVGIHTGPLVAGSVGGAQRLEYTVLGDTVNTASRLENYNKDVMDTDIAADGCRILIGPRTRDLLPRQFLTRPLGQIHLKGREGLLSIHGVIGVAPTIPSTALSEDRSAS